MCAGDGSGDVVCEGDVASLGELECILAYEDDEVPSIGPRSARDDWHDQNETNREEQRK